VPDLVRRWTAAGQRPVDCRVRRGGRPGRRAACRCGTCCCGSRPTVSGSRCRPVP